MKIGAIISILSFIKDMIPIIGGLLSRKKAKKLEKALNAVTDGVETYTEIQKIRKDTGMPTDEKVDNVKKVIQEVAVDHGVDEYLKKKVEKYKDKAKEKVGSWVDRLLKKVV